MKRLFRILSILLLGGLYACDENSTEPATGEENILIVTGLPGERIEAYSSFNLKVLSPSSGYIEFSTSQPDVAVIQIAGLREYKVTVAAPREETPVVLYFVQEAHGQYPELTAQVHFTVLPYESQSSIPDDLLTDLEGIKVTFQETKREMLNPERGFYQPVDIFNASSPLKAAKVKADRLQGRTLWYIGFYLTDFMKGDISEEYLNMIQESFDALREGGSKCVLRFAYRDYHNETDEMDPEVAVVLRHVEQLKPLLQKNEDVIFVLQAGFVGAWGEWYYTSHFGFNPSKDADFEPRRQLTTALLDALPVSRQIQLRTPEFKMRMYYLSEKDTITAATAHNGSALSRLAGHNDCFGASVNDYGTFDNVEGDREFWKGDSRYFIMGGETCGVSDYCTCEKSLKDMKDYHWTYLNIAYHGSVLERWRKTGCYEYILDRLGYRLVLKDLFYDETFAAGEPCSVTLRLYNTGFAAPMNPRNARLVWVDDSGNQEFFPLGSDPRTWHPGFHIIQSRFTPTSSKGTLYLDLSDPLIPERWEYSIALANEGVFDSSNGWNKLFTIQ